MNFLELQDETISAGGYGTIDRENAKVWLNRARRDVLSRFRWSWLQKTADITTVPGAATVALPTDVMFFGRLQSADGQYPNMTYIDMQDPRLFSDNRRTFDSSELGIPRTYSIFEGKVWFYPTPDRAITYSLRYWKTLTAPMDADDDPHGLPLADEDVLVAGALYHGALYDRNAGMAQLHQDAYEGKIAQMIRNEKLRQGENPTRARMPDEYGGAYDDDWRA